MYTRMTLCIIKYTICVNVCSDAALPSGLPGNQKVQYLVAVLLFP